MHDTHYVDRQVRPFLQQVEVNFGDISKLSLEDARTMFDNMQRATARPIPDGYEQVDFDAVGRDGTIPCRFYRPVDAPGPLPILLLFTGGTFVVTSREQFGWTPVALAMMLGCEVVVPLHRIPPEHRFPAAFDDCFDTYRWLLDHAGDIGGDASRIAVIGESSGATLAAAVCLDARHAGLPQPVIQVLAEPLLDQQAETVSLNEFRYILSREVLRSGPNYYFGDAPPALRASPLRAETLAGVAPAYVITAGLDALRDEGIVFVSRLRREGVPVTHRHHDGQLHGFFSMFDQVLQSKIAFHETCAVIKLAFDGGMTIPG